MAPPTRIESYRRDDLVFDVRDEGPLDGNVVVLLHGFPQLNSSWEKVSRLLHAQGLRTIAPNQRGYSPGARPKGRRPYRLPELVADTAALIERVGEPVHLVGHDWGAAVGWSVAGQRRDLVRTWTAVSVPHPAAFLKAMPRGQALDSWYMLTFNIPVLPEWLLTNGAFSNRMMRAFGMSEPVYQTFRRDFGDAAALKGGLAWYRAMPLTDMRAQLGRVRVPTTYVWSTGDAALGRAGAELCGQYVDAPYRFEVLEGVSHWIPDEAPEQLATAILQRIGAA